MDREDEVVHKVLYGSLAVMNHIRVNLWGQLDPETDKACEVEFV